MLDYTCGVAVGTDLSVDGPVTRAIVRENGIMCSFKSAFGDLTNKLVPITVDQYSDWLNGTSVQYAMPHLDVDTRELFITGMVW
ncbi:hypothetical protein PP651_gp14 [Aeromonas phage ZPAH14]|uniref:Uncharacterized protein n=1 Tax=Aeromonas phage ZPAH14 TaxID=2924887 RepID=A0AAE9GYR8_9CAUD|nr:hypothetical protein PP651_gp14 [Aeromonas phage ZPAH14]UOT58006.1 hypothetical protein [Aeromonas phage ZPAH14]